jgi:ketosteroid isomerase-like protein
MGRIPLSVTIAFLAGLGTGLFVRNSVVAAPQQTDTHAADLAAIEKLHQEDTAATLTQDPKELIDIWTEDAVRFNPEGPPAVGKPAIQAENEKARVQYPGFKVLSYTAEYKNIQIEGGLACEWGEHKAQYKLSPESQPASLDAKALDVLKRQSDGSWKFVMLIPEQ